MTKMKNEKKKKRKNEKKVKICIDKCNGQDKWFE